MKKILFVLGFLLSDLGLAGERIISLSFARGTTNPSVAEVSTVQAVADVAGSLSGKYFDIYSAGDAIKYRVWMNVDGVGTAPSATGVTLVPVVIATGDLAGTVAAAINVQVDALAAFVSTVLTDTVTVTNAAKGATTNVAAGTSGFTVGVSVSGVSGSELIVDADIKGNDYLWKICNDAVQTSTYLFVGKAIDPETDGVSLGKGKCLECANCKGALLKDLVVSSQAASGTYSIVQYRK